MTSSIAAETPMQTVDIQKIIEIAAPIEIAFEAMLEELGPEAQLQDGSSYPFKLEPWPGGRWYRDLGDNTGHLWGHVQVIKPPKLLEICGPLMMSYPAMNHVQYRFTSEGNGTKLAFVHRGIGLISEQLREGMPGGWASWADRIRQRAERQAK
ncbi:SRPBCC family protein [Planctomicrobium piriforme]|uniref:Uncharacterized conserved protein YndB, AHSA1/START domain n=1 Tax=Planctomicrobium piriforme TaxID=1576369 RepID=A0A1I3SAE1_9PLAN|nr:SRPBCC domain-containing protein [Planctomicrobium piriforme]SFJ55803.1 Uncharacterized conserved protein YndB, AHSA1/START domain [Planctomicrobium piriforme]